MLKDIVQKNRSYRRFYEDRRVDAKLLAELVGLAQHCPSAKNMQPLKFFISTTEKTNSLIFPTLAWAGFLKDWAGPSEGERPAAYIVIVEDQNISQSSQWDQGIVAQTIMLGATEQGLGGCIIAAIRRDELAAALNLPQHLKVALVLAIGYPKEHVEIVDVPQNGDTKYYRNEAGTHFVPKRSIDELIVK